MKELDKLRKLLEENDIAYTNKSIVSENDGIDIVYKNYDISVISHKYSYGGDRGLLEIMASFIDNHVKGYMTANEVMEEIKTLGNIEVNPEEFVKGKMQEIAKKVNDELPVGFGFVVLSFSFDKPGLMMYVSNADRQDIVKAMKEWIEKTESNYGNDTGKY